MIVFYAVILGASILALVISIFKTNAMDLRRPVIFAVALIAIGAWIDTGVSLNSTPSIFYFSQFMIAFAAVYFMGPMVFEGMFRAIANGPAYIISFSVIFGISQTVGGLAGAAGIQAFTTIRTKMHYADMVSSMDASNPATMTQMLQGVQRQATIAAYDDLFFLMAVGATITVVYLLMVYLYYRYHNRNPLGKELAALAEMMGKK